MPSNSSMWQKKTISVVLPTFNEKSSIRKCIHDFERLKIADEIIVVNNNAAIGTSREIRKTGAIEIIEKRQGYGQAIQSGLNKASGDYIIVCEPDGTFEASDIFKLLSYSFDFDFVVGTRTTQSLIWQGANMGFFMKWGNYFLAKIVEFLYNTTQLTDVGCTFRLIKRNVLDEIREDFKSFGNDFGLEMILLVQINAVKFIQIPVNYKKRIGESSVTGSRLKALILATQMLAIIIRYRLTKNYGNRI